MWTLTFHKSGRTVTVSNVHTSRFAGMCDLYRKDGYILRTVFAEPKPKSVS